MTVLDASAVLALANDEPGADVVAHELDGAILCSVNLAEVVGKLVDVGADSAHFITLLEASGVGIEPLDMHDAQLAGAIGSIPGGRALSLGDRCCLAVASRCDPPEVLTADRAWAELDLPVAVRLIR